jgi:hypothetical protein
MPPRSCAVQSAAAPPAQGTLLAVATVGLSSTLAIHASVREADMIKLPRRVVRRLSEAACYAA